MPHPDFHPVRLAAAACLLAAVLLLPGVPRPSAQETKLPSPPPTPVVVVPVEEKFEAPQFTYNGFLEPLEKAFVSAVEPGFVKSIRRREGEQVKRGDVLAVLTNPTMLLDLDVMRAQVKENEAELEQSRVKLRRARNLYEKKLVPAERLENEQAAGAVIEARLKSNLAMARRLTRKLKMLVIRSPINGQIIKLDLELGQWVTPNKEIYRISNFDRFEVRVGVPGKFLNTIPHHARVTLIVPEIGASLKGRVSAVIQHVDAESGNFTLRIEVENPRRLPLSGLVARATVPVGPRKKVKVVPRDAIVRRGQSTQVVVVRENAAQIITVTVQGNLRENVIVVAANLKVEEPVVVRGNERLFPGMPVQITEAE